MRLLIVQLCCSSSSLLCQHIVLCFIMLISNPPRPSMNWALSRFCPDLQYPSLFNHTSLPAVRTHFTDVFPGWAREYAIMAAGTTAELICYAQHPCLSQDVVIEWHVLTEGEAEEDVGRGSYHTNDDLGQLHLQRGLNISTHCFNFYCHSMLLIPAVAVNNHTRVWCGAYTKVCPGNERNPAPPITIVVQGEYIVPHTTPPVSNFCVYVYI